MKLFFHSYIFWILIHFLRFLVEVTISVDPYFSISRHTIVILKLLLSLLCFFDAFQVHPFISVQHVMLEHEDQIKYHGNN